MIPNHATQVDPYLHGIKGESTATIGSVPTANGGSFDWQLPATGGSGSVVKTVATTSNTMLTGTTLIPFDNTKPQITEGTNVFTVIYTPTSASSKIRIEIKLLGAYSVPSKVTLALFKDAVVDAIAASSVQTTTTDQAIQNDLAWEFSPGSINEISFTARVGGSDAGTYTLNGNAGAAILGGVAASSFVITEIKV